MAKMSCFSVLSGRKKKSKGGRESSDALHYKKKLETLQLKSGEKRSSDPLDYKKELGTLQLKLVQNPKINGLNSTSYSISVPLGIQKNSACDVKVMNDERNVRAEAVEVAYEGGDEGDEDSLIKRDLSDSTLQSQVATEGEEKKLSLNRSIGSFNTISGDMNDQVETESEREAEVGDQLIESGHVSDPGLEKVEFWATQILKRSCSNLETSDILKKIADQLPPSKSHSFEDLENLAYRVREEGVSGIRGSPRSVMTPCSADRVMLKKHSSSQVLPSGSRRLWWKLFLWSHRNLHKSLTVKTRPPATKQSSKQEGGYCSDNFEPSRPSDSGKLKLKSPVSFTEESEDNNKFQKWGNLDSRSSGFWPQNQWVAFSAESSSLKRVDEWVNDLEIEPQLLLNDEENGDDDILFPPSPEAGESSARVMTYMNQRNNVNISEEVVHANSVIRSLSYSSTVAHISAMSLKIIPTISNFSSLRSVNLSGNFIVRITPGSLPKGLHTLNLSRNTIVAIEGLRELTRLRVLDLRYNKISRIGHGLSNCTLIKELYLAGNKISDLEGLHRLLKLTVLDLSFNKVTTAKALGQLVANYNSLLALNLLGNPVQSNIGDDQLRKVILGILPQLAYLNKQPIKPQRSREVAMDNVAKAALGNNGWTSQRKQSKRVSQGGPSLGKSKSRLGGGQKNKHRSKNSNQQSLSPLIRPSPAVASSSQ